MSCLRRCVAAHTSVNTISSKPLSPATRNVNLTLFLFLCLRSYRSLLYHLAMGCCACLIDVLLVLFGTNVSLVIYLCDDNDRAWFHCIALTYRSLIIKFRSEASDGVMWWRIISILSLALFSTDFNVNETKSVSDHCTNELIPFAVTQR